MGREPQNWKEALFGILEDCQEEVEKATKRAVKKVADEALDSLLNNSNIPVRTGEYKKGFYIKKRRSKYIIANKQYQLTHLIEKPHNVKRSKEGPVIGQSKAHPHWEKAQKIVDELPQRIKEEYARGN